MLKKVLFVSAVMLMMVVSCAGNLAVEIGDEFSKEFDHEFQAEFMDSLNIPDEITFSKQVNGDTVLKERIETRNMDNHHDFDIDLDDGSVDIDSIDRFSWDYDEDGFTFEMEGKNERGQDVSISADLTEGNSSTVVIEINE